MNAGMNRVYPGIQRARDRRILALCGIAVLASQTSSPHLLV